MFRLFTCSIVTLAVLLQGLEDAHSFTVSHKHSLNSHNVSDTHNASDSAGEVRPATSTGVHVYEIPETSKSVGAEGNSSDDQHHESYTSDYIGVTVVVAVAVLVMITIGCFVWHKRTTGSCFPTSNQGFQRAPSYH